MMDNKSRKEFNAQAARLQQAASLFNARYREVPTPPMVPILPLATILADQNHADHADQKKLFPKGPLKNINLSDAILKLQTERSADNTDMDILRDFTNGNNKEARKLQDRIRKARNDGRTSLPKR